MPATDDAIWFAKWQLAYDDNKKVKEIKRHVIVDNNGFLVADKS